MERDGGGIGKKCIRRPTCGLGRVSPEAAHMDFPHLVIISKPARRTPPLALAAFPPTPAQHFIYEPVEATLPRIFETSSAWQRASRLYSSV